MSNPEKYLGKTLENKNQIFELLVGKAYIIEFIIYIYTTCTNCEVSVPFTAWFSRASLLNPCYKFF